MVGHCSTRLQRSSSGQLRQRCPVRAAAAARSEAPVTFCSPSRKARRNFLVEYFLREAYPSGSRPTSGRLNGWAVLVNFSLTAHRPRRQRRASDNFHPYLYAPHLLFFVIKPPLFPLSLASRRARPRTLRRGASVPSVSKMDFVFFFFWRSTLLKLEARKLYRLARSTISSTIGLGSIFYAVVNFRFSLSSFIFRSNDRIKILRGRNIHKSTDLCMNR